MNPKERHKALDDVQTWMDKVLAGNMHTGDAIKSLATGIHNVALVLEDLIEEEEESIKQQLSKSDGLMEERTV